MTATEILRSEHELIDRALDRLEALCGTLGKAGASAVADSKSMSDTIEFIQAYADERHHRKEEQGLFPALERCGVPHEAGPIAVMLHDHAMARELVAEMAAALRDVRHGVPGVEDFVEAALQYVTLMRDHIHKENNILLPMADRLLTSDAQAELAASFAVLDRNAQPLSDGAKTWSGVTKPKISTG
jgi:hemerythrin-like domain-containing protein